ncbi:sensor histidine kinase [uncultured Leifsonia sp.]|uniref:sensor histidine kinase n=1 Tax=uncultured Leifsonia sp. TaxID=340359 RepID=UPI0028D6BB07|nr:sensor histidine kinase [uncultured Leifsonia sp.]
MQTTAARIGDRGFRDWIVYSAVATVVSVLLILANPYPGFARTALSAAIVFALFPLYWLLARPVLAGVRGNTVRAWCYVVIAIVAYLVALGLNETANVALFVISPQIFLLLGTLPAALSIVVVNVAGMVLRLVRDTLGPSDLLQLLALTILIIVMSIWFSNRIISITRESSERGLLIDRLREQQREIAELSERQGAATERERIAREMHDTLAQGFTSIVTLGHAAQAELETDPTAARRHVRLMTETAQENLQESRRIIAALTPVRLEYSSLDQALQRVTARFVEETGVRAAFDTDGEPRTAPPAVEVVALRVLQEALANVRKHARATEVSVRLAFRPAELVLTVADDGGGFDPDAPRDGYGLDGMAARVTEVGGRFELHSRPGTGTTLTAALPAASPASTEAGRP